MSEINMNELPVKKQAIIDEIDKEFPGWFKIQENWGGVVLKPNVVGEINAKQLYSLYCRLNKYNDLLKFEELAKRFFPEPDPIEPTEEKSE